MILVIEAGYHGMVAVMAASTFPAWTSTRSCASAAAREIEKLAVTPRASATVSVRAMVLSRESITSAIRFAGFGNHAGPKRQGGYVNRSGGQKQNGTPRCGRWEGLQKHNKLAVTRSEEHTSELQSL